MPNKYIKEITDAGITNASDGVLRDFVYRGQWSAAAGMIPAAVRKRKQEINFLLHLEMKLNGENE